MSCEVAPEAWHDSIPRVRVFFPTPQFVLQPLQSLHGPYFTGQYISTHWVHPFVSLSVAPGQFGPVRERECVPAPHEAGHPVHAVHADHTHGACVCGLCVCGRCG